MTEFAGWKWLTNKYEIDCVHRFRTESQIGTTRKTETSDGYTLEVYPPSFRPSNDIPGHLTFAFKHEGIHLEFLARLFSIETVPAELQEWIKSEPTGSYARRACFFYEWITGNTLNVQDIPSGNYVDAMREEQYFTATNPIVSKRWRVRDNLPGTASFCPVVQRSPGVQFAENYNCAKALIDLETKFGQDIIMRSAVWLTVKESRASFAIEHEDKQLDRIKRFASVMENRCGKSSHPLSTKSLSALQSEILGQMAIRFGLRRSPVFVGHSSGYTDVVDYIAPHWDDTSSMLEGLSAAMIKTEGRPSIVRAAIASFGFVYIHPMSDGNGRISRFLVNDILRKDGAVPAPFILPISATITHTASARAGYDKSLEVFSKPLLNKYGYLYRFGTATQYDDGIESNFIFDGYEDARPAWRYPDLTSHVEYLGTVIHQTITKEMNDEAKYMRSIHDARREIKNWLEGPDSDIDRIIRAVRENNWSISNKLQKEFPSLNNQRLADNITDVIRDAFKDPIEGQSVEESSPPAPGM